LQRNDLLRGKMKIPEVRIRAAAAARAAATGRDRVNTIATWSDSLDYVGPRGVPI
jgi:hypothetical protein